MSPTAIDMAKVYYAETKEGDSVEAVSGKLALLIEKSGLVDFIGKGDFTAVKLHFGEEGNTGYIRHEWVREVVRQIRAKTENAFLTDSNVLYKNSMRTNSVDHLKMADEHGFGLEKAGAPVLIADGIFGRNFTEVRISKKHFEKVKIASDIASSDSMVVLTHVTGHFQTGLGGAMKNLGMGCASRRGKYEQHSGVVPDVAAGFCVGCGLCAENCPASSIAIKDGKAAILKDKCIGCGECVVVCRTRAIDIKWSETLENLSQKMVEYAYGAVKSIGGKAGYINFLIKVTKDCDCIALDAPRIVRDLGILASTDPVAIDKASADLVNASCGKDVLKDSNPHPNWMAQLEYAETLGLGRLNYRLERVSNG